MPRPRRRRFWRFALGTLATILILLVYAAWPGRWTYTVSPETTYVTGPLDSRGHIDYPAALHERLSQGVTPENNANVLIWKALGPHPEGATMPPEYFQWLGYEPPEQGEYMISWDNYLKELETADAQFHRNDLSDQLARAAVYPWSAEAEPQLARWLKRNEKPLAVINEATRRPQYYNPLVPRRTEDWSPGLIGALLPNVQRCRELAGALACRAMLRVHDRKIDEAWQDLLACHRLGRLVGRGATLIEWLVGVAIDQVAGKADVAFLELSNVTAKQAIAYWRELEQRPPVPPVAEKFDLGERFFFLDSTTGIAVQGPPGLESLSSGRPPKGNKFLAQLFTRSIDWDPALRKGNDLYDRLAAAARIPDRAARRQEFAGIERDVLALKPNGSPTQLIRNQFMGPKGRGEAIGNILLGLLIPATNKVRTAGDRHDQSQRNLHLAFALAAYRADHGRYPAALDELAPKYIDAIPGDLFSGTPLVYRPEGTGYLLYSVGPNETDDEGRGSDDFPPGDDITIRVPVPRPRLKDEQGEP